MPTPTIVKSVLTIDTVTWTAIAPPFACNTIVVKNADPSNEMKIRTDSADAATQDTISIGSQELIQVRPRQQHMSAPGFDGMSWFVPGVPYAYVQATVGTGPAIVTYSR